MLRSNVDTELLSVSGDAIPDGIAAQASDDISDFPIDHVAGLLCCHHISTLSC